MQGTFLQERGAKMQQWEYCHVCVSSSTDTVYVEYANILYGWMSKPIIPREPEKPNKTFIAFDILNLLYI